MIKQNFLFYALPTVYILCSCIFNSSTSSSTSKKCSDSNCDLQVLQDLAKFNGFEVNDKNIWIQYNDSNRIDFLTFNEGLKEFPKELASLTNMPLI